jgi:hypothetical protein
MSQVAKVHLSKNNHRFVHRPEESQSACARIVVAAATSTLIGSVSATLMIRGERHASHEQLDYHIYGHVGSLR